MNSRIRLFLAACLLLPIAQSALAQTASDCVEIGRVVSAQGVVRVQHSAASQWSRVSRDSTVCEGDTIQTGNRSRAAVNLSNETVLRIRQQSTATLANFSAREEATSLLRLLSGVIHFFSRKPREYAIRTSTATIGVRGTEFVVSVAENETDLTVFEGTVQAENDVAPVTLGGGETVRIVEGTTLRAQTIVRPRELVQWGLYYPPVLMLGDAPSEALARADECARSGDYECAFGALDEVAENERDTRYLVFEASLSLAVGDLDGASASLREAQSRQPGNAASLALSAIIALTQNRNDAAFENAQQAVAAAPESAAALLALSYVQQAGLELEAALATIRAALENNPGNALGWARLSEIQLALGRSGLSRDAARRAAELEPNLARTRMVTGYAALAEMDADAAISAFDAALELDSADPLAHLGLGLGLIRKGNLAAGRREIEAAVALDSGSAILRPYLGRAYFEEKRPPLDAEQYAIAKQLDPNDPTAYLFDALRLHAENRPLEAAEELRASIERNDNRAVYRGRNLLDQDRAARGASLARIFDTLDFTAQGVAEASKSLANDPANASAHRFLSDSYRPLRRREIARVSELLQAQMLQDINNNPVQPSVSAANLNLGTGAGDVGLNEFTGLFESNGIQPAVSVLGGDNDTRATEVVLSGIYDSLSISLGAFDYETEGWRENNAQDQQLSNVFVQWAATPELNFQFEVSSRESTEGDLAFDFDPDSFDPTLENSKEFDAERFGLRYSPSPRTDLLLSHVESEREEDLSAKLIGVPGITGFIPNPVPPPPLLPVVELVDYDSDIGRTDDGSQSELQYLLRAERYNLVGGIFGTEIDTTTDTLLQAPPEVLVPIIPELDTTRTTKLEHERVYLYLTYRPTPALDLTIGVSDDDFDDEALTEAVTETNAKFGLRWNIDKRQTFRLAALQVMKPALANNRLLEPTQVAGFNQFFDDVNGTQTELVGIGYDIQLAAGLHAGIELTSRDLEIPFRFIDINPPFGESTEFEKQEEEFGRVYLYWAASESIAVTAEITSDTFESGPEAEVNTPVEANTRSLPIGVKYFSPRGWYAAIKTTFVDQEIERNDTSTLAGGDEDFNVVDLGLGYRLPRRMGSVSLEINNATDETFNYQDDSYREFRDEPSTGPYFPERTAFIRVNLVF